MSRRLLTCGEHAVLVELDGLEEVMALDEAARTALAAGDAAFADVTDIIPAARTLLLMVREGARVEPVRTALPTLALPPTTPALPPTTLRAEPTDARSPAAGRGAWPAAERPTVEIPVEYDGPDLDEVCKLTGLTRDEVVSAHTHTPWRVAFTGFSPGFAYLCGGDSRLQVPRRSEPRTSVPAGSVGLAGEFSAVYPRSTPGGWQLLGHTDAVLWDVDRQPPALLQPGSTVRFVDIGLDGNAASG